MRGRSGPSVGLSPSAAPPTAAVGLSAYREGSAAWPVACQTVVYRGLGIPTGASASCLPLAAPAAAAPALPHSRVAAPALVPAPAANPSARLRRVSLPLSCSRLGGSARSRKFFMTTSGTAAASLLRGRARYACVRAVCRASLRRLLGVCVCVCVCVLCVCVCVCVVVCVCLCVSL